MKRENNLRKIIINSLLGFPIGITLLMINYTGVFLIAGENTFIEEISQLQNISTLVLQLITIGWSYHLFFILISIYTRLINAKSNSDKFAIKHPYTAVVIMIIIYISSVSILILLNSKIFSKNLSIMNCFTFVITTIICGLYSFIKIVIESNVIKKINRKLKERSNYDK